MLDLRGDTIRFGVSGVASASRVDFVRHSDLLNEMGGRFSYFLAVSYDIHAKSMTKFIVFDRVSALIRRILLDTRTKSERYRPLQNLSRSLHDKRLVSPYRYAMSRRP